jgi:hypothetical protein
VDPICLVARRIGSGETVRLGPDELRHLECLPFLCDDDDAAVSYYASAEHGSFLALEVPGPAHTIDLYPEFRNRTNGLSRPFGSSLLGALRHYGLRGMASDEKDSMRALAQRGGPYAIDEIAALLAYCEADVDATGRLLERFAPDLDWRRAELRSRFARACAKVERAGIPIDLPALKAIREHRTSIRDRVIDSVSAYGVFEKGVFKQANWELWVESHGIVDWPLTDTGKLALDDKTFRTMGERYPEIEPVRTARAILAQLEGEGIEVGQDGRARCLSSMFGSLSGRSQPSATRFIFSQPSWLRLIMRPEPGHALVYLDWKNQEFAIAGVLAGDNRMLEAYETGCPYLGFAKQAGRAPAGATPESHPDVRKIFKTVTLGVGYGMGEGSLALKLKMSIAHARELLSIHRRLYARYWAWTDAILDYATIHRSISTVFGWTLHVTPETKFRTIKNFPLHGNGSELLRLAACFATETGLPVVALVHDALMLHVSIPDLEDTITEARLSMDRASEIVLRGYRLRIDEKVIQWPDRFPSDRGSEVRKIVEQVIWPSTGQEEP